MSVGTDGKINKKNDKLHLPNALKGLARVGCAGSFSLRCDQVRTSTRPTFSHALSEVDSWKRRTNHSTGKCYPCSSASDSYQFVIAWKNEVLETRMQSKELCAWTACHLYQAAVRIQDSVFIEVGASVYVQKQL
jgi:hypothetical protein